ncbi:respiratory selenite reductase subunit SrrC [Salisediminibacterium halotolerans]|uniref:Prokaryotic molybdopterin-containing oxidoreductase family, membrane subunit n=1 Tax=Salisediminibacterium halotolerans TaxID=517425 RepID=A0A1H9WU79_9BACI|nr:respiratory selenite reductase subunit SrrC [Salisediminibacterium haloalkalitolerans]SES37476.1 prokaryotic molybdopterin-containing oxidoreductase family, membrane subunit [Salisediminibacterium haloalkalitolerans]
MLNRQVWIVIAGMLVLVGAAGIINIFINGEHVMGTSNYVPWGSLIAFYVFFVATSTGFTFINSLAHVFKVKRFEFLSRRLTLASIAALLMGFVMIGVELGNPLAMVYIMISPNFAAPIVWMGLLYGLYLVLHIVEFIFQLKNNHKVIDIISPIVLAVAIAAQSMLGAVFGMSVARGFWNEAYTSISFIVLAFLSGIAAAVILTHILARKNVVGKADKKAIEQLQPVFSKLLLGTVTVVLFFTVWKWIYGLYGTMPGHADALQLFAGGPLTAPYWLLEIGFVFVVPILLLVFMKKRRDLALIFSSLSLMIGIFAMRVMMVFAGQMAPLQVVFGSESAQGIREVSIFWSEWATAGFGIGGVILIYMIGEKWLDLNTASHDADVYKQKQETYEFAES